MTEGYAVINLPSTMSTKHICEGDHDYTPNALLPCLPPVWLEKVEAHARLPAIP